mmetsp:Transcript_18663/g.56406  ORF Transcript_18663/g.56406 Transcript_18663/m.56406 type:complete len:246 (+) Transcript_18663:1552-2289(+)
MQPAQRGGGHRVAVMVVVTEKLPSCNVPCGYELDRVPLFQSSEASKPACMVEASGQMQQPIAVMARADAERVGVKHHRHPRQSHLVMTAAWLEGSAAGGAPHGAGGGEGLGRIHGLIAGPRIPAHLVTVQRLHLLLHFPGRLGVQQLEGHAVAQHRAQLRVSDRARGGAAFGLRHPLPRPLAVGVIHQKGVLVQHQLAPRKGSAGEERMSTVPVRLHDYSVIRSSFHCERRTVVRTPALTVDAVD